MDEVDFSLSIDTLKIFN